MLIPVKVLSKFYQIIHNCKLIIPIQFFILGDESKSQLIRLMTLCRFLIEFEDIMSAGERFEWIKTCQDHPFLDILELARPGGKGNFSPVCFEAAGRALNIKIRSIYPYIEALRQDHDILNIVFNSESNTNSIVHILWTRGAFMWIRHFLFSKICSF